MNKLHLLIDLFFFRRVAPLKLLFLLAITVLVTSPSTFAPNQDSSSKRTTPIIGAPNNVLVLFLYHRAAWSDNVQKGIESVFTPYQEDTHENKSY